MNDGRASNEFILEELVRVSKDPHMANLAYYNQTMTEVLRRMSPNLTEAEQTEEFGMPARELTGYSLVCFTLDRARKPASKPFQVLKNELYTRLNEPGQLLA